MNDGTTRAELFSALESLADIVPQMRVGQLIAALGEVCVDLHGRGLWDAEDADLLEALWQFRRGIETATVTSDLIAEQADEPEPPERSQVP